MNKDECCPKFDPKNWDKKMLEWKDKKFIKETIPTLFHIPFPPMIGKKVMKMCELTKKSDAELAKKNEILLLFHDPSAFKSEIYYSVTKKVEGANNTTISGAFESMVFEGPYNAVPKHIKIMEEYLSKKNKKAKDYFIHYAYCPKCAKKFGQNYSILFAEV